MPVAKKTTAMTKWDEKFAAYASKAKQTTVPATGNFITTRSGIMQYQKKPIPGNALAAVILDTIFENDFYLGKFDPEAIQAPDCFAMGRVYEEMKPHVNSAKPQHPTCMGCPQNDYGTADNGKGKACSNRRRMSLIPADSIKKAELVAKADVALLKTTVTSARTFDDYVSSDLADTLGRPPFSVVTVIKLTPHPDWQFVMGFELQSQIDDDATLVALEAKIASSEKELLAPYEKQTEGDKKPVAKKSTNSKFTKRGGR